MMDAFFLHPLFPGFFLRRVAEGDDRERDDVGWEVEEFLHACDPGIPWVDPEPAGAKPQAVGS